MREADGWMEDWLEADRESTYLRFSFSNRPLFFGASRSLFVFCLFFLFFSFYWSGLVFVMFVFVVTVVVVRVIYLLFICLFIVASM